jgi:hypothetical protein
MGPPLSATPSRSRSPSYSSAAVGDGRSRSPSYSGKAVGEGRSRSRSTGAEWANLKPPGSPGMTLSDAGSESDKGKIVGEVIDFKMLEDIPAWLRSLRLHKVSMLPFLIVAVHSDFCKVSLA